MVSAVTTGTDLSSPSSKADNALSKFSADFENFLTIFVTQLENQDPLEPQDSSDFTAQIAQFSTVEQSVQTNKNLENIVDLFTQNSNSNLVSYSGKYVEVEGDSVRLEESPGNVSFRYYLDEPARESIVSIYNLDGQLVFSGGGINDAGNNNITWDGTDSEGEYVDPGYYIVRVAIRDQSGNLEQIPTIVKGRVDGISLEGDPVLEVNGSLIPLENVTFIGEA